MQAHTDVGVGGAAALEDLCGDLAAEVDRDRKAQAGPGRLADGGVDADHLAAFVDQRPAAVAGVHGGIGLQVGHPLAFTHRIGALHGADDARGHGVVEAEGVADGDRPFAGAHLG